MKGILRFSVLSAILFSLAIPTRTMDMARVENRTDQAVAAFGSTGQNVIVAIIDRGIDWRNQDFRKDDGSTRIKYIFDLTDNTGANAPGNTYAAGTIYTEAQINAALNGGTALVTRDAVGHGTTTTGIAAGDGSNLASRKYRGVAPSASIIAVKFTTEGAPAHDGQPAESPFYQPALFPKALDFVRDKSIELGMPAVMLANFGSPGGPTDGTDELSRKIDSTVGAGKRGLVFVTGPGDDGGMPNRAGGNLTQGGTAAIQVQKNGTGSLTLDLWYPGDARFNVTIQTPSGTFGPYIAPAADNGAPFVQNSQFNYYHRGPAVTFFGAQNGKREIFIQFLGATTGTFTVTLTAATVVSGGRFDATLNPSTIHVNNRFTSFVVPGNVWSGATAFNNISPGDYIVRRNWVDIDGIPRSITNEGELGDIWLGSSAGPSFDGRLSVDLAAPGDHVFTTLNPTSNFARFRGNHIQDGNLLYTRASAVSAAAPQVTGLIALMLEENPMLDALQIRSILRRTSRKDSFTGPTANPTWGHGKMDAHAAVQAVVSGLNGYEVSGRVTTPDGRALRNAIVAITDSLGVRRTILTNSFGFYSFSGVETDKTYAITVSSRRYRFSARTAEVIANLANFDFIGLE